MKFRDEGMDEIREEEMRERRASRREAEMLTHTMFAQVVLVKDSEVPVAVVWHDFKTGITHIRAISEQLNHDMENSNPAAAANYVEMLVRAIRDEDKKTK